MAENIENVEDLERRLAELRAVLGRIEGGHLEIGDRPLLLELISELIEQAEANGQQWVSLGLSDEEEALVQKSVKAIAVEDSTSENLRR